MRFTLLPALPALLLFAVGAELFAGETTLPRRHFKESRTYPYIFRSESYLATSGPVPVRFADPGPECGDRSAPALRDEAKGAAAAAAVPAETLPVPPQPLANRAASQSSSSIEPPLPEGAATNGDGPDFAQIPDAVIDFFRQTEGKPVRRNYLFDPIFQPATPAALPRSRATYREK